MKNTNVSKHKIKSITYHVYAQPKKNIIQVFRQENTYTVPNHWAKTKKQALDNAVLDILDKILLLELNYNHYNNLEKLGYSFRSEWRLHNISEQKLLHRMLYTLMTGPIIKQRMNNGL